MAYGRDTFHNPATGETYAWPINHSDEQEFGKTRQVASGAPTGHTGLTFQQGADEPMELLLEGTILHRSQHQQMIRWWAICAGQSIYFTDFAGDAYEVIITDFNPVRKRTLHNPRDPSIRLHYWTYTIRMQVIGILAGPWVGVAP
jgi:hypothetical protein